MPQHSRANPVMDAGYKVELEHLLCGKPVCDEMACLLGQCRSLCGGTVCMSSLSWQELLPASG